ncbi:hypothetical protein N7470_000352 [Penicillium chermesinum]|nr:hypothetical protein N7470_000352 [Penicillium chermesinum]
MVTSDGAGARAAATGKVPGAASPNVDTESRHPWHPNSHKVAATPQAPTRADQNAYALDHLHCDIMPRDSARALLLGAAYYGASRGWLDRCRSLHPTCHGIAGFTTVSRDASRGYAFTSATMEWAGGGSGRPKVDLGSGPAAGANCERQEAMRSKTVMISGGIGRLDYAFIYSGCFVRPGRWDIPLVWRK